MSVSETKWVRLGEYIERNMTRNSKGIYGEADAVGVNIEKIILPMRGNIESKDFNKFFLVPPKSFAYNPRGSRKLGIGLNLTQSTYIITFNDVVFRIKPNKENELHPEFLFIFLSRKEWDRYAEYLSRGSSTEVFSWDTFCDIKIPLPSIEVQRELVDTYNGLKSLAEQNETLIPRLSAACQAYIVDCRAKYPSVSLGEYIEVDEEQNINDEDLPFMGIYIHKEFMPTNANTDGLKKNKYLIMRKGRFVFSGMQTGRDIAIRVGLYNSDKPALISPAYITFSVSKDKRDRILPEYLNLQFKRSESDRLGWFYSDGSIRSNLDWDRFCEFQIPLPPIDVQQAIVDVYHCMERAKQIAITAREKLKTLCPALAQRAAHS